MASKLCPKCQISYDETLNYCLECGAPLEQKMEEGFQISSEEPLQPPELYFQPVLVRGKKGEEEVVSWKAFQKLSQTVGEHDSQISRLQTQLEQHRSISLNILKAVGELETSFKDSQSTNEDRLRKLSDEFSMINTTVNNQLADLLASVSAVSRSVRELDSQLKGLKESIDDLLRMHVSLTDDITLIKNKMNVQKGENI